MSFDASEFSSGTRVELWAELWVISLDRGGVGSEPPLSTSFAGDGGEARVVGVGISTLMGS